MNFLCSFPHNFLYHLFLLFWVYFWNISAIIDIFLNSICRPFKHICRQPGLLESLKTLTSEGDCDKLALAFLNRLVVMAVKQDSDMSMSESSDSEAISSTPAYFELLHDFLSSVSLSQDVADELTK